MSSSPADNDYDEDELKNEEYNKKEGLIYMSDDQLIALRELWKYCAEQNVKIPSEIHHQIFGRPTAKRRMSSCREIAVLAMREHAVSKLKELLRDKNRKPLMHDLSEANASIKNENPRVEMKIKNASYKINEKVTKVKRKIDTVGNENLFYKTGRKLYKLATSLKSNEGVSQSEAKVEKVIIDGVNLSIETGKLYLLLGAPGSGKSTLLKMIANALPRDKDHIRGGEIVMNGILPDTPGVDWTKLVAYSDQHDQLHKHLTVEETLIFAWKCRMGGTHARVSTLDDPEIKNKIKKLDDSLFLVNIILGMFALTDCKDTLIGDNDTVRGISGGEKRRVTCAEIMMSGVPFFCLDEVSTGLDAVTTYDIVKYFAEGVTLLQKSAVVSLVAPAPETVALFDEVILLDSGRIMYSGGVEEVVQHFTSLGYELPDRMDFVDWLQALPTEEGSKYLANKDACHLTSVEFAEAFAKSDDGKMHLQTAQEPMEEDDSLFRHYDRRKNSWYANLKLLVNRELLIWRRNNTVIRARVIQNCVMGVLSGTLFWQQHRNPQSVVGIMFQAMFFVTLGAIQKVPPQYEVRSILYKQQDAKFFPTWAYVIGRSLAFLPSCGIDSMLYGTIVYWFVGLAYNDGASIANYLIFVLLIFTSALSSAYMFGVLSTLLPNRTTCQSFVSLLLVYITLFSGFTVQADTLPSFWIWAYWTNPASWTLRALVVNEFQSGKYDNIIEGTTTTEGEAILSLFGFTHNGKPFKFVWVWYCLLVQVSVGVISILASTYFLQRLRYHSSQGTDSRVVDNENDPITHEVIEQVNIPVQKATLTFKDIRYTINASRDNEQIELLKGVEGIIESGKMTALMGSSGAGKTTLLDVLALRKKSSKVSGEVRINGHLQEAKSFRRCAGYVEQFDVQSPQLTVRETVEFSAQLRLEETDPNVTPEHVANFVDETLATLELIGIQDRQVGEITSGGLSSEQLKRLSVAVELVANPSIIFLDEPTTGLDARAASTLMRGLKRIAQSGRAVCATVHQPSVSVFNSFDALLLLKRGGETVFFGDLGHESSSMIEYFERYDGTPKIQHGENPGTWMLNVIGGSPTSPETRPFDYARSYAFSALRQDALRKIQESEEGACESNKIYFPSKYATSKSTQRKSVLRRTMKIYWRSPRYNLVRLTISALVSLLFGSVFASGKIPVTEGDMNSRVTTMFITFLFLCVTSINTVLHVFYVERNMFYRHKAARMYDKNSILLAFSLAEIPFILLSSFIFVVIFYFMMGFEAVAYKFFLYYLFFTANMLIYTFIGQMLMSLVRDASSAQIFGSLAVSMATLFSGILIRPQNITNFWLFAYWIFPGHYILEGLVASQFHNDDTPITPTLGSEFCDFVADESNDVFCTRSNCYECSGTAEDWIAVSFDNQFQYENLGYSIIYLFGAIFVIKYITYVALMKLNYLAK